MDWKTCPICRQRMPANPRYPGQVCESCVQRARDEAGRPLLLSNIAFSGGFEARDAETGEIRPSHVCFVDGIRCWADEAHLGGIVVQITADA